MLLVPYCGCPCTVIVAASVVWYWSELQMPLYNVIGPCNVAVPVILAVPVLWFWSELWLSLYWSTGPCIEAVPALLLVSILWLSLYCDPGCSCTVVLVTSGAVPVL